MFNLKDLITKSLKSFVVYKFVCPGCNACYIGETTRQILTRIKEHLEIDKKSHIFGHLVNNEIFKAPITGNCFEIIDSTSSPFRLKYPYNCVVTFYISSIFTFHFLIFPVMYYFLFEHLI